MEFKITTEGKEEVPYFLMSDPSDSKITIPDARGIEATGYFGTMRFYEIECPDFSIWYNNYQIVQRTHVYGAMDAPMLELHFTLKNTVHYKLEGLNEATLLQGQFNLSYAPYINNITWFQKNENYTTFDIHFAQQFLNKFAASYPLLGSFLEKSNKHIAGMLAPYHGQLTPEMSSLIRRILNCRYLGELRNLYLQSKVIELLILAMDQIGGAKKAAGIALKPSDIEKIRQAHDLLLRDMENPCTLIELSHKTGLNDFKLKKGFKQLYGTTIYDYFLNARMEQAKTLLLETDMTVLEISIITGYKNLSSFAVAFRKKMGYSPGTFKKIMRNRM
ncbi:MAG TPA: AraC family transcriptional regulator [Chitinophagaceae bacterium]